MSGTYLSGPTVVAGPMFSLAGVPNSPDYNPYAGPSVTYQGDSLPDIRFWMQKDQQKIGGIPSHFNAPYFLLCDTTPAASAASPLNIAPAANAVSGTPMTLVTTTTAGITPGLQLVPALATGVGPQANSGAAVSVIGLDFGFATGTTVAGNPTFTVVRSNTALNAAALFSVGQWICIGGAGNVGGTISMFTKVTAVSATQITVSPAPAGSVTNAPIGSCNLNDPYIQAMQPSLTPTSVQPYLAAGLGLFLNPLETCKRNVGIQGVAGGAGGSFIVRGYTDYGEPVSETIVATSGATVTYGKKTFKYIASVTPQFSDAHNYAVGTGDTFGFAVRSDFWEYTNLFYNGTFVTTATGWLAADLTNPQTSTNGDSRGTLQVSARGNGTQITGGTPVTGSIRLAIFASLPLYNVSAGTPSNVAPMYGFTPA